MGKTVFLAPRFAQHAIDRFLGKSGRICREFAFRTRRIEVLGNNIAFH